MKVGALVVIFLVGVMAMFVVRRINGQRAARRRYLLGMKFDHSVRHELARDFAIYGMLPDGLKDELDGLVHVFVEEKAFEACGGLEEVSGHMQRVIGAQACLMLLRIEHDFYEKLRTVLVYPGAYKAEGMDGSGDSVRLGESWGSGSVVLSWESVLSGGRDPKDGHDVSIHEFSHQLDQKDGAGDGVPVLDSRGAYREWAGVFRPAFEKLQARAEKGKTKVLDDYGAENPAEFFAVATETFYEKPKQLAKAYPKVFEALQGYYGVDPRDWK